MRSLGAHDPLFFWEEHRTSIQVRDDETLPAARKRWAKIAGEIELGLKVDDAKRLRFVSALGVFFHSLKRSGTLDFLHSLRTPDLDGADRLLRLARAVFGADIRPLLLGDTLQLRRILIAGPTGAGKEGHANAATRALQELEKPEGEPTAINCAAFEGATLNSELFGHTKGAFTGATAARDGVLGAVADRGVLFADELGDMPTSGQVRLLRVLQTGQYRPLGADRQSDQLARFHLVAATSMTEAELRARPERFRPELLHRFAVVVRVPSLRQALATGSEKERKDLLSVVVDRALWEAAGVDREQPKSRGADEPVVAWRLGLVEPITQALLEHLGDYDWPGNLRECANITRRIALEGATEAERICNEVEEAARGGELPPLPTSLEKEIEELKRARLEQAWRKHSSVQGVAKELGLSREQARRWLKDHRIRESRPRASDAGGGDEA